MAKPSQILNLLEKLYAKRAVLDKQISDAAKELLAETKKAGKLVKAGPAKKLGKKPGRKPNKKPGKKPSAGEPKNVKPAIRKPRGRKPAVPIQ